MEDAASPQPSTTMIIVEAALLTGIRMGSAPGGTTYPSRLKVYAHAHPSRKSLFFRHLPG